MNIKNLIFASIVFSSLNAMASQEQVLFTLDKSHNPQNKVIIHTQTDEDCRFIVNPKNSERNYVDFYWSMKNGKEVKEVHSLIRSEIKNRVEFKGINDRRDSFKIRLSDLSELRHDLPLSPIEVMSEMSEGVCRVRSVLSLGGSARYRKIDLKRTFCEVSKNFIGIPNGCHVLHLEGNDIATGELVKVKFLKK
jgi:hypothetical protein